MPSFERIYIVLGKYRSLEVSTAWAYKTYRQEYSSTYLRDIHDLAARAAAVHSAPVVKAILEKNAQAIAKTMHNDLEKIVLSAYPQVLQLKEVFASQVGVIGTMMSGSGPSVFALCETQTQAEEIQQRVRQTIPDEDLELFVTHTITHGIQVLT